MSVDPELLEILVCPQCKGDLNHQETQEDESLICPKCELKYEIRDGIPVMLVDEAEDISKK
jgi:hypothetical protein